MFFCHLELYYLGGLTTEPSKTFEQNRWVTDSLQFGAGGTIKHLLINVSEKNGRC
jgi:hypothetical protein